MSIQAIIFDFDGVLVDSLAIKGEAFATLYAEYGHDIAHKVLQYHHQHGGISRFEKFRYFHHTFLKKTISETELDTLNNRFSQLVMNAVIQANAITGSDAALAVLQEKLPLHVVSATPEDELKTIVIARNMQHYFASVHGSPETKLTHIKSILLKYRYHPMQTVMIGDALVDYHAAVDAAIQFVGYVTDGSLNPFPPNAVTITTMQSLPQQLGLI